MLFNLINKNKLTLLTLCQQLHAGLKGGLSLHSTLNILKKDPQFTPFFLTLSSTAEHTHLQHLFNTLAPPKSPFKTLPLHKIANLPDFLDQSIDYLETQKSLRSTLVKKLTYPLMLLTLLSVFFVAIFTLLLPHYTQFFNQLNTDLPPVLSTVLRLQNAIPHHKTPILIGLIVTPVIIWKVLQSKSPGITQTLFSPFHHSQRLWVLGLALKNGISLKEALHSLAPPKHHPLTSPTHQFKTELTQTGSFIKSYTQAFHPTPLLTEMLHQTVRSGQLHAQLLTLAKQQFNIEKQTLVTRLQWVQPILLICIGLSLLTATALILYPLQHSLEAIIQI